MLAVISSELIKVVVNIVISLFLKTQFTRQTNTVWKRHFGAGIRNKSLPATFQNE